MRCIDADALKKQFEERSLEDFTHIHFIDAIDNAPTIEERPTGEWINKRLWDNTHIWVCSECGNQNKHGTTVEKACWKCGANMKLFEGR